MYRIAAYLLDMLPGAVAALALYLCLFPRRRRQLIQQGLTSSALREAALCLFWMFCGGMAVLTLTPRWLDMPFRLGTINLTLFRTFRQNKIILLGNIVMFVPFGLFPALLWRGWTWRRALLAGAGITAFIECTQLLVGRAFDVDDLLLNTLGAFLGWLLWRLLRQICPRLTERFHCQTAVV